LIQTLQALLHDQIEIGVILGAHGLNGETKIRPYTDDLENFQVGKQFILFHSKQKKYFYATLNRIRPSGSKLIAQWEGYTALEEAHRLMGFEILTSIQELIPKGPNEYFFYEVLGCSVIDESGINIGIVVDILETGAHNVIVIREDSGQEDAQEILIPFVQAYIIQADYVNRIIHMRVPRYQS